MDHALRYRMKRPGDDPVLIELWNSHGGWGPMVPELWRNLMVRGARGEAPIVVAEDPDNGEIVGQLAFLPAVVSVRGRRVRALRAFAAILATAARQARALNPATHPIANMYRFGLARLRPDGYSLVYCLPNPAWLAAFRLLSSSSSFLCYSFPTSILSLPLNGPLRLPPGYVVTSLEKWDERVDELQAAVSCHLRCFVYRSASELRHRVERFRLRTTAVERNGVLVGLALHKPRLIADVLTIDAGDSLVATLAAACNAANQNCIDAGCARRLSTLAPPAFQSVLRDLGFRPGDYHYPLVVQALDPSLGIEDVRPQEWYLTALD